MGVESAGDGGVVFVGVAGGRGGGGGGGGGNRIEAGSDPNNSSNMRSKSGD